MAAHDASTSGKVGIAQISGSFTPYNELTSELTLLFTVYSMTCCRWAAEANETDAKGATGTACFCQGAGGRGPIDTGRGGGGSRSEVVEVVLVVVVVVVVVVRRLGRIPTGLSA